MTKFSRKSRLLLAGAALAVVAALPRAARAQSALTLTIDAPSGTASWNAVSDPASTAAVITYTLFQNFGINVDAAGAGSTNQTTEFTSAEIGNEGDNRLAGSYCFKVRANSNETATGGPASVLLGSSLNVCHGYLHTTGGGNASGPVRSDASGQQVGFGDLWNFSFAMDDDADVIMQVYPPGTTFTTGANGLVAPSPGSIPTKTIFSSASLSGEGLGAPFTVDGTGFWDGTDESGVLQSNGLYFLYISVNNPLISPSNTYAAVTTIPLDYRFTAFNTTGISATVATADVNYTITANSNVRTVIAMPGRHFTIDSSSNVQALNAAGTAIDTSTNSVVAVIQGQVNYGANTATWNGLNTLGVAVATGVYSVGMSATDGSNNPALNISGFNGPLTGTIAVDRIPAQTSSTGTAPSVSGISIGGTALNLSGGTSVTSFGTINITLSAAGGNGTTVSLTGPLGTIVGGITTISGTAVTFSTGVAISTVGAYSVTINPDDPTGDFPGPQQVTNFTLTATPGPSVSSVTVSGTVVPVSGGGTVSSASPFSPTITITLSASAGSNTSVTLTGPTGPILGGIVGVSGSVVTYSTTAVAFSTPGAYSLTVNPVDVTNTNAGSTDNTAFTITAAPAVAAPGASQSSQSLGASTIPFPNPAKTSATIKFQVAVPSNVTIDIYTLTGRRVLHQAFACAAPGACSYPWALVNDTGGGVASGIYNVHLTVDNSLGVVQTWKKLMVLK